MHASVVSVVGAGLNFFVAATLTAAAVLKIRNIQAVERVLMDTLPSSVWRIRGVDSRRVGWAAVVGEAFGGVALVVTPREVYPAVSGVLVCPLVVILGVAVRAAARKVPCGCFGGSRRNAGVYEVGRAALLVVASLSLCAATELDSTADPTIGSLTGWSWAIAALLTVSALAPVARLRTRGKTRQASKPVDDARGAAHSRRRVLHGVGLAVAAISAAAVIPKNLPAQGHACKASLSDPPECSVNCKAAYDRCYGHSPDQNRCCINCYVSCQNGEHKCSPGVSCDGAWHNPFTFG